MNKAQIMKRAHELAKGFEGHYHARLSLALRMAWAEAKVASQPKTTIISVKHQPSGGKEWVAEITGRHPKFKFEREFLIPVERRWSSSGKTGRTLFELEEGRIYEVNEPWKGRYFVTVVSGEIVQVEIEEVLAKIA